MLALLGRVGVLLVEVLVLNSGLTVYQERKTPESE